ncbi:MAG: alpha/beta fold hydrolase [Janthinobacterium lividum]
MSNADSGFVRLASGMRLRYRCAGDEGPTVLLLHGWPETGHAWRRVLPTLAASGYVVVAPDLRGSGDSDKPIGGYEAKSRMEDVRALIASLALAEDPVFVVGHGDAGAETAQAYAAVHSEEVAGLALLSAAPGLLPPQLNWLSEFHQTPDLPELLIGPHLEAYLRHFFRAWSHDPEMLPDTDLAVYAHALTKPGALRASLAPFRIVQSPLPALRDVPTLLLLGESDPRIDFTQLPEDSDRLRVQTIPRGGHWLPEERPDPVAAALLTFFSEARNI